jgi:cytochrome b6-f complex iron-sulfur subunit
MAEEQKIARRDFFARIGMWGGMTLAYGALGVQGLLFLLPERMKPKTRFLYIGQASDYEIDQVNEYVGPDGKVVLIKRTTDGFIALSSICPHLGCKVNWEAENNRFFCPCHSGVFDPQGIAIGGPPADAGQRLTDVPLKVDEVAGVLYLEVKATTKGVHA